MVSNDVDWQAIVKQLKGTSAAMVVKAAEDAAKAAVLEGKKQVAGKHLIVAIAEQQRASQSEIEYIPSDTRSQMFTGSRMLLERFMEDNDKVHGITEQSYLDEIDLLLRSTGSAKRLQYVRTRVSSKEIKGLEVFGLGDNYS